MTEEDIAKAYPVNIPTSGVWAVTDDGKIVPANTRQPELDCIADIQTAPLGPRNVTIICASSLMFSALKKIKSDPKHTRLGPQALEALDEALAAAE